MYSPTTNLLRTELPEGVGSTVLSLHSKLQPYSVTSGYGLFRRMTGVDDRISTMGKHAEWGGLPASMVAVPVVVLEGSANGQDWHELPFRYVQGDTHTAPRRTAPLQPRLGTNVQYHHTNTVYVLYIRCV
jgi:hypothetical protein